MDTLSRKGVLRREFHDVDVRKASFFQVSSPSLCDAARRNQSRLVIDVWKGLVLDLGQLK